MNPYSETDIGLLLSMNDREDVAAIRRLQQQFHQLAIKKGWYECPACKGSGKDNDPNPTPFCEYCSGSGQIPPCNDDKIASQLLNIICEVAEAREHQRKQNHGFGYGDIFNDGWRDKDRVWHETLHTKRNIPKPDGFAIELADVFIRLLDLAEYCGIDLGQAVIVKHRFNELREYKHGGLSA